MPNSAPPSLGPQPETAPDALFSPHLSEPEYLHALATFDGTGPVPLLGPPGPAQAAVAELTGTRPHRPLPRTGDSVVLALRGSISEPYARSLAAAVGASCVTVESAGAIGDLGPAEHVALVALADELTEADLTELHETLWRIGETSGSGAHLGVLTGNDPVELSWLIAKGLALPRRRPAAQPHLRVWPAIDDHPPMDGSGRWIVRDEAMAEVVLPLLTGEHSEVLTFFTHGRDDAMHLTDTVVCAFGPQPAPEDGNRSGLPTCAFTGRCFRSDVDTRRIVRADAVRADIVLANSCHAGRISDGLFRNEYLLAHGFLAGIPAAFVSSPQITHGVTKTNALFHLAMERGATVGQAASLVNDHLRLEGTDYPCFTVYGLPWLTAGAGQPSEPNGMAVTGSSRSGRIDAGLADLAETERCGVPTTTIVLSTRSRALLGELPEAAAGDDVTGLRDELRRLGDAVLSLRDLPLVGFPAELDDQVHEDLALRSARLAGTFQGTSSIGDPTRVRRGLRRLGDAVRGAEEVLARRLFERGTTTFVSFSAVWSDLLERPLVPPAGAACPYCGRPVMRTTARHPLFSRIARDCLVCAHCRVLSDVDATAPLARFVLDCEKTWQPRRTVGLDVVLEAKPGLDAPVDVLVAALAPACVHNDIEFPPPQRVTVDPGETARVGLRVEIGTPTRLHQQFLQAFAIAGGTVSFASRPIWIAR